MLQTIKTAAMQAIKEYGLVGIHMGMVTSTAPIEVTIEDRLTLSNDFLIVPEYLSDYEKEARWITTKSNSIQTLKIYNSLKAGEKVVLVRVQGGQKYLVLDRVVEL